MNKLLRWKLQFRLKLPPMQLLPYIFFFSSPATCLSFSVNLKFHLNVPVSSVLEFLLLLLLPESFLLLFPGSAHLTAGLLNYDILLFFAITAPPNPVFLSSSLMPGLLVNALYYDFYVKVLQSPDFYNLQTPEVPPCNVPLLPENKMHLLRE